MKISSIPRFVVQHCDWGYSGPEFRGRLCSLKSFVHTPVPIRFLISDIYVVCTPYLTFKVHAQRAVYSIRTR